MKYVMTFKSPDPYSTDEDGNEFEGVTDLPESVQKFVGRYVEFMEYISVEFDTEANTATVIKIANGEL